MREGVAPVCRGLATLAPMGCNPSRVRVSPEPLVPIQKSQRGISPRVGPISRFRDFPLSGRLLCVPGLASDYSRSDVVPSAAGHGGLGDVSRRLKVVGALSKHASDAIEISREVGDTV